MDDIKPADNQDKDPMKPDNSSIGNVITPSAPEEPAPSVPAAGNEMANAPAEITAPEIVTPPAPMETLPKDSVMPGLENEADKPPTDAPSVTANPMDTAPSVAPSPATAVKKKSGMGIVIAVVVIVVFALAAVGYVAFVKDDGSKEDTNASQTEQTTEETNTETADTASDAIDEGLKGLDETKDFNSTDIDDSALGL